MEGMGQIERADAGPQRGESPVEMLLGRIDKALAVHGEAIQGLDAILAPAMRPSVPTEVTAMAEDRVGGSPMVGRLTDYAERIESMTDKIRGLQQRLEV